jgi:hypothetical protein
MRMGWLIWVGAAITAAGFLGILWTALAVLRARRAGLDDAAMKARLQQVLPVNIAALFLSMLGLGAVIIGAILS